MRYVQVANYTTQSAFWLIPGYVSGISPASQNWIATIHLPVKSECKYIHHFRRSLLVFIFTYCGIGLGQLEAGGWLYVRTAQAAPMAERRIKTCRSNTVFPQAFVACFQLLWHHPLSTLNMKLFNIFAAVIASAPLMLAAPAADVEAREPGELAKRDFSIYVCEGA